MTACSDVPERAQRGVRIALCEAAAQQKTDQLALHGRLGRDVAGEAALRQLASQFRPGGFAAFQRRIDLLLDNPIAEHFRANAHQSGRASWREQEGKDMENS